MSPASTVRCWSSRTHAARHALEDTRCIRDAAALRSALGQLHSRADDATFLVARLDPDHQLTAGSISKALEVDRLARPARLCLAASHAGLAKLDTCILDSDRIGLMLDDVDAQTPAAHLIWDRIEAIRFQPEFVASAARNLRLSCALESMLRLAKEIGLCTLGTEAFPYGGSIDGLCEFDYVPSGGEASVHHRHAHEGHKRHPSVTTTTRNVILTR